MRFPRRRVVLAAVLVLLLCLGVTGAFIARSGSGEAAPTAANGAEGGAGQAPPAPDATAEPAPTALGSAVAAVASTPKASASAGASKRSGGETGTGKAGGSGAAVPSVKKGASTWKADGMRSALSQSGASWYYNWAANPNGVDAPSGVEYVPMIWGAQSVTSATIADAKRNGKVLLGFNEPDLAGQAEMSVEQALDLWPKLQATGMRLGSPAVAFGADTSGGWLDRFMAGAKQRGLRVDFITLHWYGGDFRAGPATDQLRAYIAATHARYGKPVWLTEYALMSFSGGQKYPSAAVQADFVTRSTAMLRGLPYVERYAWFSTPTPDEGGDGTGLYRPDGTWTAPGNAYRRAR